LAVCWDAVRIGFPRGRAALARPSVEPVRTQLLRFVAVGATNTAITLTAYAAALHVGVRYLLAGAAAYALGGLNGFLLNRRWTFGHRGRILPAAARYAVITAGGIGLNLALLRAAIALGVPRAAGELAAVAPVTLLSFALNRAWAFASSDVPSLTPALVPGCARRRVRRAARAGAADPAAAGDGG
jgi:putative flippase GtrA